MTISEAARPAFEDTRGQPYTRQPITSEELMEFLNGAITALAPQYEHGTEAASAVSRAAAQLYKRARMFGVNEPSDPPYTEPEPRTPAELADRIARTTRQADRYAWELRRILREEQETEGPT
jgi:hypothetical protein